MIAGDHEHADAGALARGDGFGRRRRAAGRAWPAARAGEPSSAASSGSVAAPRARRRRGRAARSREPLDLALAPPRVDLATAAEHGLGRALDETPSAAGAWSVAISLRSASNGIARQPRVRRALGRHVEPGARRRRRAAPSRSDRRARPGSGVVAEHDRRSSSSRVVGARRRPQARCTVIWFCGQRAGLVGRDDRRAPERLDRRQVADDRPPARHPLYADRERDRDDGGQALGHGGHGEADARQRRVGEREAARPSRRRRRSTAATRDRGRDRPADAVELDA